MISEETVIVLGAGASAPYGFPTGPLLTSAVISKLGAESNEEFQLLAKMGYDSDDINDFQTALAKSGKSSIDAFLEHRESLRDLGKAAMAACLIPGEQEGPLFGAKDRWYQQLFAALNAGPGDFAENKLSVITFNYDRSLEQYLHTCLTNSYGLSSPEAAKLVGSIPVIHVHGQLGKLPWMSGDGPSRSYRPDLLPKSLEIARDSIRIVHEGINDPIFQQASDILNAAQRIVFIGFGYDPTNVRRLRLDKDREHKFVGGSCFGFTDLERGTVGRMLPNTFVWGHRSWKALEFLRERVELV